MVKTERSLSILSKENMMRMRRRWRGRRLTSMYVHVRMDGSPTTTNGQCHRNHARAQFTTPSNRFCNCHWDLDHLVSTTCYPTVAHSTIMSVHSNRLRPLTLTGSTHANSLYGHVCFVKNPTTMAILACSMQLVRKRSGQSPGPRRKTQKHYIDNQHGLQSWA